MKVNDGVISLATRKSPSKVVEKSNEASKSEIDESTLISDSTGVKHGGIGSISREVETISDSISGQWEALAAGANL